MKRKMISIYLYNLKKGPKHDGTMVMNDLNAKVKNDNNKNEKVKKGEGDMSLSKSMTMDNAK